MSYVPKLNLEDRKQVAGMIVKLFDHWRLSNNQQLSLLGLNHKGYATLNLYRNGSPLPKGRDIQERVGYLFAIHRSLRILFPGERTNAYQWMTLRNRAFGNYTPVEVVEMYGYVGLLMIRTYLDRMLSR